MAEQKSREELEREWWAAWRAEDYSWDGLAKKRWEGWSVTLGGGLVETKGAPEGAQPATLQDYWRDEEANLIEGDGRRWTRAHCPLAWVDGTPTPKSAWSEAEKAVLDASLSAKLCAAAETAFDTIINVYVDSASREWRRSYSLAGADRSVQFQGCVLFGAPTRPESDTLSVRFEWAYFSGNAIFFGATFSGDVIFDRAIFSGDANFDRATFSGASFGSAIFSRSAKFFGAKFSRHALFDRALFLGDANFGSATFSKAKGLFSEGASFGDAIFSGCAGFRRATFPGNAGFHRAFFSGDADFDGATFSGPANFVSAIFSGDARFNLAVFAGRIGFDSATFSGHAHFDRSTFVGGGNEGALSARHAVFRKPVFFRGVGFPESPSRFSAAFRGARFEDVTDFSESGARFVAALDDAMFEKKLLIDDPDEHVANREYVRMMLTALRPVACAEAKERAEREREGHDQATEKANRKLRPVARKQSRAWEEEAHDRLLKELEGGCRVVKVAMGRERDEQMEQRYYRFQLIARRKQLGTPFAEKLYSSLYGGFSDYGMGLWQPFVTLLFMVLGFGTIYWAWGEALQDITADAVCFGVTCRVDPDFWDAMMFSANNVFRPFGVWGSSFEWGDDGRWIPGFLNAFRDSDEGHWMRLLIRLVASLQSLLSVILFFLFGLAVKRRFQIS